MDEKEKNIKEEWWRPGVVIFSEVSSWIVAPLLIALFLGKYLDGKFDTKPWIFLSLAGLSFIFSCFGIWRVINRYMKKISDQANSKAAGENIDKN